MPTLTRLLLVLALLAGAVFAAMWALTAFVRPEIVPITVTVPIPALQQRPAPPPAAAETPASPPDASPPPGASPAPEEGAR